MILTVAGPRVVHAIIYVTQDKDSHVQQSFFETIFQMPSLNFLPWDRSDSECRVVGRDYYSNTQCFLEKVSWTCFTEK